MFIIINYVDLKCQMNLADIELLQLYIKQLNNESLSMYKNEMKENEFHETAIKKLCENFKKNQTC